jgi:hypothetical protein
MSVLGNIPIIGSLFGGGDSGGGIAGSVMDMTGLPQLFESLVVGVVVIILLFKFVDRI